MCNNAYILLKEKVTLRLKHLCLSPVFQAGKQRNSLEPWQLHPGYTTEFLFLINMERYILFPTFINAIPATHLGRTILSFQVSSMIRGKVCERMIFQTFLVKQI